MIRPGEPWGADVSLRGDEPTAHTDDEVANLLEGGVRRVLLSGGDLFTSLGGQAPPSPFELPIDLLEVTADGHTYVAAAHVVARRRWWSGEFVVAMNATHLGPWNLGPKAHPNDGIVDVTAGSLSWADRVKARRRAPAGAHVPHPGLTTKRSRSLTWNLERSTPLFIDGVCVGSARSLEFTVRPDVGSVVLI